MSRSGLACAAGLHANTLSDVAKPVGKPISETLAKAALALLKLRQRCA